MKLSSLVLAAFTLAANAAAPVELTASSDGNGSVTRTGMTAEVTKANLVLRRDGRMSLGLLGKDDYMLKGRWQPADGDSVSFRITDYSDREADGAGRIDLRTRRDGSFELVRISLNGTTDKGQSFAARFAADRPVVAPPPPPKVVLDAERTGRGIFRTGGQNPTTFRKVHVILYSNGKAHVHTEGAAQLRYEGTWTDGGPKTAALDVRGGIKGERLRGAARHHYGRVTRVELSGTVDGRYYSIEFDPVN